MNFDYPTTYKKLLTWPVDWLIEEEVAFITDQSSFVIDFFLLESRIRNNNYWHLYIVHITKSINFEKPMLPYSG